MFWFKKKSPTFKEWIAQGYSSVTDYESREAYVEYEEWMKYNRKMTLNEFLKEHPGYGMLQVHVDKSDIITIHPTARTNMTIDLVKEHRSRDPFCEPSKKDSYNGCGGGPG